MRIHGIVAALALSAAIVWGAQQRPAPPHVRTAPAKPGAPVRKSDAQIEAGIRAKMAKSKIGSDKFQFHVQGGVATIEGKTDVVQHKGTATRMAKAAGAVAVNNHVQLSDAAKQKAAANLEKGRRRAQIKRGEARSSGPPAPRAAAPSTAQTKSGGNTAKTSQTQPNQTKQVAVKPTDQ